MMIYMYCYVMMTNSNHFKDTFSIYAMRIKDKKNTSRGDVDKFMLPRGNWT